MAPRVALGGASVRRTPHDWRWLHDVDEVAGELVELTRANVEAVVEAISNVCRTGKTGDGKIFLAPVGEAVHGDLIPGEDTQLHGRIAAANFTRRRFWSAYWLFSS